MTPSSRMSLDRWFALFRKYRQKKFFSFRHLELLTGLNRHSLRIALKRLADKGVIQRISRGFYANPLNLPVLEEISAEIYRPSYISLESALSRAGVLSQIPYVLTCVTPRNPRTFQTSFGTIEYRAIQKKYFFGYQKHGDYSVAEPEKALLDFLYLHKKRETESFILEWDLTALDERKIRAYARRMNLSWPLKKHSSMAA